jgi:hypothetical protein
LGLGELGLGAGAALFAVVGRRRGERRELGVGDGVLGSARRRLPHEGHGTRGGDAVVDAEGGVGDGGGVLAEEAAGHCGSLLLHGCTERLLARALGEHPRPVFLLVQHCLFLALLERSMKFIFGLK